jgi:arsenate reductase-like glutaredoxin family protein
MNIQIFGKAKCFETKKAERYFKERRIRYQYIDLLRYGMSRGELNSVKSALGLSAITDENNPDYPMLQYLAYEEDKLQKLFEEPGLLRTPIVRNGRQATAGYCPEVWKTWKE